MTIADLYRQHPALERVENRVDARLTARTPLVDRLPKRSIGAEIGVYTGVFSEYLINQVRPTEFWMVDAWDINGERAWNPPPGAPWSAYVDHGNLTYDAARQAATLRSAGHHVVTAKSVDWCNSRPADSLDWVYLDTTHRYSDTVAELHAIAPIIKPGGLITGDDAWENNHGNPDFGVIPAIRDFCRQAPWEVFYLDNGQFALRGDS